ncbi:hypothetical protein MLD38_030159 [Melastoma candidum]|uniref:Uncharacterized protein n=1 Tax=Melastoma candidum TaxID=119954 RepID=A0ACB9MR37_9MYRT|nr:hypothetical protein MLD38_030159 [Melastoma candidum]
MAFDFDFGFSAEDMAVSQSLGYPAAFAKLCRDRVGAGIFINGPPFSFSPYCPSQDEVERAEGFERMFPIVEPKAKPTTRPEFFTSLLWKQLNHLGNAGFDPAVIRVDPYGNVVYYHADSASPLAWEIDHWFPCSRGGLTVARNLRILQWQVRRRKHDRLEILIPWWDFQLGISVNQFLSVFASANSDFRHRAFSFLFFEGENEEVNTSQAVDSHSFPNHFLESKERVGLAAAAMVFSRKESHQRPHFPAIASKVTAVPIKENGSTDQALMTPYQEIAIARDSLRHKEDQLKMQSELYELNEEVLQMKRKNEEDKVAIQDLELTLIKRRRRAEKCRRLAEAQSSYRTMLEKMIRDAMHQSVVYKEQMRLNQAAASALMARLEAQKAMCDASERELHKIHKQKDEITCQIRPESEQARKRSRMDATLLDEDGDVQPALRLTMGSRPRTPSSHKELRKFLEEEHKAYIGRLWANKDFKEDVKDKKRLTVDSDEEKVDGCLTRKDEAPHIRRRSTSVLVVPEGDDEDGEGRNERGKENVERWLQMLLGEKDEARDESIDQIEDVTRSAVKNNTQEKEKGRRISASESQGSVEVRQREEPKTVKVQVNEEQPPKAQENVIAAANGGEITEGKNEKVKEKGLGRSESARILRRIPSSPAIVIGGLKKGVSCMTKKPLVFDDVEGEENRDPRSNIARSRSPFRMIRKSVKL